jgi:hypothetical protein
MAAVILLHNSPIHHKDTGRLSLTRKLSSVFASAFRILILADNKDMEATLPKRRLPLNRPTATADLLRNHHNPHIMVDTM